MPLLCFLALAGALVFVLRVPSGYDEIQHLSYAAALQEAPSLVPAFDTMRLLDPADLAAWTGQPNYHAHPTPFYLLAGLGLDRSLPIEDTLRRLRLGALLLVAAGLALALAGGRAFAEAPGPRLAFGFLLALCPPLVLVAAHFTNDSAAILAGGLACFAASRTRPAARDALVAAAIALAFWTKLTAGLLLFGWAVAFALLVRAPRLLGAVAAAAAFGSLPYLAFLLAHGSPVPVTLESVHGLDRAATSLAERLADFAAHFPFTWGIGLTGHPLNALGFVVLCGMIGWGTAIALRRPEAPGHAAIAAAPLACLAVLAVHLGYAVLALGGNPSAASLRYYLPLWPMLAQAALLPALAARGPGRRRAAIGLVILALLAGFAIETG